MPEKTKSKGRVQYQIPSDRKKSDTEALCKLFDHPQWPNRDAWTETELSRWMLNVLYIWRTRESGSEWYFVDISLEHRARKPPLTHRWATSATKVKKLDMMPTDADRSRLQVLQGCLSADFGKKAKPSDVMRCAFDFVWRLRAGLKSKSMRLCHGDKAEPVVLPDTAQLRRDWEATFKLPLQADDGPFVDSRPNADAGEPRADQKPLQLLAADDLYGIILTTTVMNRWLTTVAAKITKAAQTVADPDAPPTQEEKRSETFEDDHELIALLGTFRNIVSGQVRAIDMADELKNHALLPPTWRKAKRSPADVRSIVSSGIDRIATYLVHRQARIEDPLLPSLREREIPQQRATSSRGWRNWTRSRSDYDFAKKKFYREISAPIDWTAVVRDALIERSQGSRAMVWHDMQAWLAGAYHVGHNDAGHLEAACLRYNRAYYGNTAQKQTRGSTGHPQSEKKLTLEQLLEKLGGGAGAPEHEEELAQFVYLWLSALRIVRPIYRWPAAGYNESLPKDVSYSEAERQFRSLTYADISELKARVYGGSTAIDGLRAILRGGILPRQKRGRAWLISGSPGSGKSTFSLNLASDMARRGRIALVVCADEVASNVHARLKTFGLLDGRRYDVLTGVEFSELLSAYKVPDEAPHLQPKGKLIIVGSQLPDLGNGDTQNAPQSEPATPSNNHQLDLSDWLGDTNLLVNGIREKLKAAIEQAAKNGTKQLELRLRAELRCWRWMSVLVDSIDQLELTTPQVLNSASPAERRPVLMKLVQLFEDTQVWGLLVCGRNHRDRETLSYLADTVLELGHERVDEQRTLTFLKCRSQPYDAGTHLVQLVEGVGTVVHPNLASTQKEMRRRARRSIDSEHLFPIPDHIYWDDRDRASKKATIGIARTVNASSEADGGEDNTTSAAAGGEALPGIRRGASILLYGPPVTGKSAFAFNLMSNRAKLPRRFDGWELGTTGGVLVVSFRGDERDCLRRFEDASELRAKWDKNVSYLNLQWYGADITLRAPHVAHELYRTIQRARLERLPLDWVVFLDAEAVQTHMPAVDAEPGFWPTILAVTNSEQVSTIFVVNDFAGTSSFLSRHRQDMDYTFRFESAGSKRVFTFEKTADRSQGARLLFDIQGGPVLPAPPPADARDGTSAVSYVSELNPGKSR